MSIELAKFIPWLPALAAVLCGICCLRADLRKFAGAICVLGILAAFLISVGVRGSVGAGEHGGEAQATTGQVVHFFNWIHVGAFRADFSYFIDPLTIVMLFVVTGIGTLVAIYATGYMAGDKGYARFFACVSLFIFAMTNLVMADNLVLLYLGWEGVGLCSYLLIGYYYDKPSAVAAAKKAFIVNRIGDLSFAIGIWLIYRTFGTVQYTGMEPAHGFIDAAKTMLASIQHGDIAAADWHVQIIPFFLMLGAFGKSAQLPLYVWLPDAMEGPTPVSALIHAATMVTAGVYMIVRLFPLFALSPYALPTVAAVGGATAIFAATIALCQYDIKRIYAYSTISQLGYMFLGVGSFSAVGGIFHLFTHAFFKALLFLTAGSVMHALGGQLDLRKMSGLRHKMPVTCWLMFIGCLALAGFPFLSGFFSKDLILAAAMERGLDGQPLYLVLAIVGLVTAFLTAFYTFRLWFRVFLGEEKYEMGEEHHAVDDQAHDAHSHDATPPTGGHTIHEEHHHEPHEMPWLMNGPLVVLAIGAIIAGWSFIGLGEHWIGEHVEHSLAFTGVTYGEAAAEGAVDHGPLLLGLPVHNTMQIISGIIALAGIGLAAYFHWLNRPAADRWAAHYPGIVRTLANKWYIDEINDALIVRPLYRLGEICQIIDALIIDGILALISWLPVSIGGAAQPVQRGSLQGYGLGMAIGGAAIVVMVVIAMGWI